LATSFQTAIKATIDAESAPLNKVQAQKDQITLTRAVYTDVKTNVDALQSAVQALISTQASFNLNMVAKATVTPGTSGNTVMSVTTTDSTAAADYDFSGYTGNTGIQLAQAESRASTASASSTVALGKSGVLWLGGSGQAQLGDFTSPSTSVTGVALGTVADGQRELGSGNYSVQVRDSAEGIRQFRLVNADGSAMSIRNASSSGYTSNWQGVADGDFDTGRGLSVTLSASGAVGSTALPTYTAKGVFITISATDTQRTIASAINAALQPEGRDFKASIISNQLVLTGAQTGENHGLIFSDADNLLGFGNALQTAKNAKFNVNGMDVSRASNTNLADVIDGVTINLASDAQGKTAHLNIAASTDQATTLMNTLVSKFNAAFTHLTQKLAITSSTNGTTTSYTRGALTGDTTFSSLRNDLYYRMSRNATNSGSFKSLADIGLSFDKDMKLSIDTTKFTDALKNNPSDLTAVLDKGLGDVNSLLSRYSGTTGVLAKSLASVDTQTQIYDKRIAQYNASLTTRKESLFNTYLSYQNTLADMGYQAQMIGLMEGTSTTFTTGTAVNTSG
jgi:flagellar capping protein FliD